MTFIHAKCIILSLTLRAIVSSTFGSVDKMMSGKKHSQNLHPVRMITKEIIRHLLQSNLKIMSMDDLISCLNYRPTHSKTTKFWTDNLIKPAFIMTAFVRGTHEQDLLYRSQVLKIFYHILQQPVATATHVMVHSMSILCFHCHLNS